MEKETTWLINRLHGGCIGYRVQNEGVVHKRPVQDSTRCDRIQQSERRILINRKSISEKRDNNISKQIKDTETRPEQEEKEKRSVQIDWNVRKMAVKFDALVKETEEIKEAQKRRCNMSL